MPVKPSQAFPHSHPASIRSVVEAHQASNPRVFGSVARGEDTEGSDLDLLVDTTETTESVRYRRDRTGIGTADGHSCPCHDVGCAPRRLARAGFGGSRIGMNRKARRTSEYLDHMLTAINRIETYTADLTAGRSARINARRMRSSGTSRSSERQRERLAARPIFRCRPILKCLGLWRIGCATRSATVMPTSIWIGLEVQCEQRRSPALGTDW